MAYQTFRVEITRDETRDGGPVGIEITAYIDRMPETNEATVGHLSRAWRGVWNSRLQYTGDFATLAEALAAIMSAKRGILVVGMHGKTTTSAIAAHVLREGGLHPSHYVGAEIPILGTNAHWDARGEFFVADTHGSRLSDPQIVACLSRFEPARAIGARSFGS